MSDREGSLPRIVVGAVVGTVFLIAAVFLLQLLLDIPERAEGERRAAAQAREDLLELQASQVELLTGYTWVDRATGTVRIPVERAMELVAAEAAQR